MIYMWFTAIKYYKLTVERKIVTLFLRPLRPYGNQAFNDSLAVMIMLILFLIS